MNIGVMPRAGEIAITPSLAKQFAPDIRTLIGQEVTFTCVDFSKQLKICGIYSGSFDDYYPMRSCCEQTLQSHFAHEAQQGGSRMNWKNVLCSNWVTGALLVLGAAFLALGIWREEYAIVMSKAIHICLECIGIG